MKEFESNCLWKPILIKDHNQRLVRHAYRAEQLVFAELEHLQLREIECQGCGKSHEWFQVDEDKALRVIERVRRYMEKEYGVDEAQDENHTIKGNDKPRREREPVLEVETTLDPQLVAFIIRTLEGRCTGEGSAAYQKVVISPSSRRHRQHRTPSDSD